MVEPAAVPVNDEGALGRAGDDDFSATVVAHLRRGGLAGLREMLPERSDGDFAGNARSGWRINQCRGLLALLDGRFEECESWAEEVIGEAQKSDDPQAGYAGAVLLGALRREQERGAEAEVLLRSKLVRYPSDPLLRAFLAAALSDLGRDTEARRNAETLAYSPLGAEPHGVLAATALADVCAVLEDLPLAERLVEVLVPHAGEFAVDLDGFMFLGSVGRAVGVLLHTLGSFDEAAAHFHTALSAERAAGATVLVAHTSRQYSATLRARAGPGDWEQALDLLTTAVGIYEDLGIERLAAQSTAVLQRSLDDV